MSRRVLIVGAGDAGAGLLAEIARHPEAGVEVVGLIDDDPAKRGRRIGGAEVLGGREALADAARRLGAEEVLIAIPSASGEVIRAFVAAARLARVRFRIVPGLLPIIRGDVRFEQVREIRAEDLLGRETVEWSPEALASAFRDRRILVTGAGGSIGSELCRRLLQCAPARLVMLDVSEAAIFEAASPLAAAAVVPVVGDVRDAGRMDRLFAAERPEVVFHAAAYKHVPLMEAHPCEAARANVGGTLALGRAALAHGVRRFVLISSDKAVRPTSVMGATKRAAEYVCLRLSEGAAGASTRFSAVRFGNVLGSSGSVVPIFRRQIEAGGPITVTHPDAVRFFMTIGEAATLVLRAAAAAEGGEVFVLDMGEPIRIADLARDLVTLAGLRPEDVRIEFTGLRPGERLREEILSEIEGVEATRVEKVFRTPGEKPAISAADFDARVADLLSAAEAGDDARVRGLLRALVPSYAPAPQA